MNEELRNREFNKMVDLYMCTGTVDLNEYELLTPIQKEFIQCIKRSFKRIKSDNKHDGETT